MAEKLFVNGQTEEVRSDYESAKQFEKVRVGSLGVYFRDGLKTRYIKYQEVDRAFIAFRKPGAECAADRLTLIISGWFS